MEELYHFLFLRRGHLIADIHQSGAEIIAMVDLVITAVRQTAFPNTAAGHIELQYTAGQCVGLFPKSDGLFRVVLMLRKLRSEFEVVNISGIKPCDLVNIA